MDADSAPPPANNEPVVSDMIDITIKTIDSKNFQFQVEDNVWYGDNFVLLKT